MKRIYFLLIFLLLFFYCCSGKTEKTSEEIVSANKDNLVFPEDNNSNNKTNNYWEISKETGRWVIFEQLNRAVSESDVQFFERILNQEGVDGNFPVGEYNIPVLFYVLEYDEFNGSNNVFQIMELLFKHGASAIEPHPFTKKTPLLAALHGCAKYEVIKLLLDNGAVSTINAPEEGYTPVMMAAFYGHNKILQILIDNGGDVNRTAGGVYYYGDSRYYFGKGGNGITALMLASSEACVKTLLDAGAEINAMDSQKRNALYYQCFFNRNSKIITLLVNSGSYLYNDGDKDSVLFDVLSSYSHIDSFQEEKEKDKIVKILNMADCPGKIKEIDWEPFFYDW
ncbi:MAG: ankyrin repeat domain-containing protein, partial [Treponema sp.]|nr:ankyrin repeat domain-containing protein [Treponema sp.]